MKSLINIYADESCHLHSSQTTQANRFMVLGGVACPLEYKLSVFRTIKKIKSQNGLQPFSEMKWTKVSCAKLEAYKAIVRYFFECDNLIFRAVIIDKRQLQHEKFQHTHDQFYYKMYWQMLEWFILPVSCYHIYLDIKDTQGDIKIKKLHEILCNSHYDFNHQVVQKIQEVRSHEIALMQLVDVLIGAISYANRYPAGGHSFAKQSLVELIKELSGSSLQQGTFFNVRKFNLFHWEGQQ